MDTRPAPARNNSPNPFPFQYNPTAGEVRERLKRHDWKAEKRADGI